MTNFKVIWEIDTEDTDCPEEAANQALVVQRDPTSIANVFTVIDVDSGAAWRVDLNAEPGSRVTRIIEYPR